MVITATQCSAHNTQHVQTTGFQGGYRQMPNVIIPEEVKALAQAGLIKGGDLTTRSF